MYLLLLTVLTVITNFYPSLQGMEKKSLSIALYHNDTKEKSVVPLALVRKTVLYEQYCKKISKKKEAPFLTVPIAKDGWDLFVGAHPHKSDQTFKKHYDGLKREQQIGLINAAGALRSSRVIAQLVDCCMPKDIKDYIAAMLMQSASESVRYSKIRINARNQGDYFCDAEKLYVPDDEWKICYEGDGQYYIAPACVIKNNTALWYGMNYKRITTKLKGIPYVNQYMFKDAHNAYAVCSQDPFVGEEKGLGKKIYIFHDGYSMHITNESVDVIQKCIFSKNGTWLVTGSTGMDNNIWYHGLGGNQNNKGVVYTGFKAGVTALCCNNQSTWLAIGLDKERYNLVLHQIPRTISQAVTTDPVLHYIDGHSTAIHSAQFSYDDQRLLTVSYDHIKNLSTLILGNVSDYKKIQQISRKTVRGSIKACFSPSGDTIAVVNQCGHYKCAVLDGNIGKSIKITDFGGSIFERSEKEKAILFSPDGKFFMTMLFASSDAASNFKLWDAKKGFMIASVGAGNKRSLCSYAGGFTPDLRYVVEADIKEFDKGCIYRTSLYNEQDAIEIKSVAEYKPVTCCQAYKLWQLCQCIEDAQGYGYRYYQIKKIMDMYGAVEQDKETRDTNQQKRAEQ